MHARDEMTERKGRLSERVLLSTQSQVFNRIHSQDEQIITIFVTHLLGNNMRKKKENDRARWWANFALYKISHSPTQGNKTLLNSIPHVHSVLWLYYYAGGEKEWRF